MSTNDIIIHNKEKTDDFVKYFKLYRGIQELINAGKRVGSEISLKNFADIFRFKGSGILTVTGIPGHGKTEFVDQIILDLARLHGHETIVCGFEQTPEEHALKLTRKLIGKNIACPSYDISSRSAEFTESLRFISNKIKLLNTNKVGGNINDILLACAKKIKESRDIGGNPKYVVIDPFNMLSLKGRLNGHEKIEEILRRISEFSHKMQVIVILVAHPTKMKKDEKTGKYDIPDFYSVKGSSAFFEMSYHGLVVYRTGSSTNDPVQVKVLKVKQNNLGESGKTAYFTYERDSGRYIPIDEEGTELKGDHRDKNWLEKSKHS